MKPMNLRLIIAFCFAAGFAHAIPNPLYFSEGGAGTMDGSSPMNAQTIGWVNAGNVPANWTVSIVGVVSEINVQANGETVLIPGGSGISSPNSAGIYIYGGVSGLTIDGTGGGFIANTANGSLLANQTAIWAIQCGAAVTGLSVKNLAITNIYVHTLLSDNQPGPDSSGGIYANLLYGSNFFGNILVSNAATGILANGPGMVVCSNCTFQSCNHGLFPGSTTTGSVLIENCFFGACSNWDTTANVFHNDAIIWFGSGTLNSFIMTGCTFNGDMGVHNTAYFFNDGGNAMTNLFANNLFIVNPGNTLNNGCFTGGGVIVNNTFLNQGTPLNSAISISGAYAQVENNLHVGFNTFVNLVGPVTNSAIDHNLYANWASGGNSPWNANSVSYNTLQDWQKGTALETSSMYKIGQVAYSDGTIPSNSPALGGGTNLSNLVQTDLGGAARSNSGPWVIGAFTSAASPVGPSRWYAALHSVQPGTTSSTQTTTNSNVIASVGGAANGPAFPVGEWPFNDGSGSTAADSSGNGDTATLVNSPAWVPGQSTNGFALSFDGASQYMTAANPLGSFANFSYSCWIKCGRQTSSTVLASGFIGLVFYSGAPHQLAFVTDGSFYDGAASSAITDDGNWHCIVGTCSGNSLTIYVDGVQTGAATGTSVRGGGNLFVGWDNGALFGYFPGTVDDVRVYKQALSATNVAALYSAGAQ
jgi:hypothetical protein